MDVGNNFIRNYVQKPKGNKVGSHNEVQITIHGIPLFFVVTFRWLICYIICMNRRYCLLNSQEPFVRPPLRQLTPVEAVFMFGSFANTNKF